MLNGSFTYRVREAAVMATDGIPAELERLVHKMYKEYTQSEVDIASALAAADGPLTMAELAEKTGYTERTIRKRVRTLEEQLGGEPLIDRDDAESPYLHELFADAVRTVDPTAEAE